MLFKLNVIIPLVVLVALMCCFHSAGDRVDVDGNLDIV